MNLLPVDSRWRQTLNHLLPYHCLLCGGRNNNAAICGPCQADLPWNHLCCPLCAEPLAHAAICRFCSQKRPDFDVAIVPLCYQAPVQAWILRLKTNHQLRYAAALAEITHAAFLRPELPRPTLLLPVPTARQKLWRRGFSPPLELARSIGRHLGIATLPTAAQLLRTLPEQIGASRAQRRRNVEGAFWVSPAVAGQNIALVDDVMTTGATLSALATAARSAGAVHIQAWAIARTPGPAMLPQTG